MITIRQPQASLVIDSGWEKRRTEVFKAISNFLLKEKGQRQVRNADTMQGIQQEARRVELEFRCAKALIL